MNLEEFTGVFLVMADYFDSKPSEAVSMVYFEAFKDWDSVDFRAACQNVMQTRIYNKLPKIAEIKEAIYGKIEDQVEMAYQSMLGATTVGSYATVIFEDGAIGRAIEAMGGWQRVCEITWDDWRFRRKEFESLYLANLRNGSNEPVKLLGLFEIHNNQNEDWKQFTPKPMTIQASNKRLLSSMKRERLTYHDD